MRERVFTIICILALFNVYLGQKLTDFTEILPLVTKKSRIEKAFGKGKGECKCRYENKDEIVRIDYVHQKCEEGWNVTPDTVLGFSITPKNTKIFEELKENEFFIITYDNAYSSYSNIVRGVRYYLNSKNEIVEVRFMPSFSQGKDSKLRCLNFPKYNPLNEVYVPFFTRKFENLALGLNEIDNVSLNYINSHNFENKTLYVFLYFSNSYSKKKQNLWLNRFRRRLEDLLKTKNKKAIIKNGGIRLFTEIETFILPKDYPPPTPNP